MLGLLLAGCVSKGSYELVEVQLDATRTALSARNASCYEEIEAREEQVDALESHLERLTEEQELFAEECALDRDTLALTRAHLASLAAGLEGAEEGRQTIAAALVAKGEADAAAARLARRQEEWQERLVGLDDRLEHEVRDDEVLLRIPTRMLFNEGQVSISPRGEVLIADLSAALSDEYRGTMQIIAHTDDHPYHTAMFASNWERGFAQSLLLLRELEKGGVSLPMSAGSAAGSQPLVPYGTEGAERVNSRLELVIEIP